METIKLCFQSPTKLNESREVSQAEKPLWAHAKCKHVEQASLILHPDDWTIQCSVCNEQARIDEWDVYELVYLMKRHQETDAGNFKKLDYLFSVSMLGQMSPPNKLAEYLMQLEDVYQLNYQKGHNEPQKQDDKPQKV